MLTEYPTEQELEEIRNWPSEDGWSALFEYVKDRWAYANVGYWSEESGYIFASTAGWSGNEELIGAMASNFLFWHSCWVNHRRGGHYTFSKTTADNDNCPCCGCTKKVR